MTNSISASLPISALPEKATKNNELIETSHISPSKFIFFRLFSSANFSQNFCLLKDQFGSEWNELKLSQILLSALLQSSRT